jgi:uncharacterized membrane protein
MRDHFHAREGWKKGRGMIRHTATVTVNKPASEVFKFVGTDYFTNHPKWDSRVVNIQLDTQGPVKAGTKGQETRKQGGRNMTYDFEVTEFKPNTVIAFKAGGGPTQMTFSYNVKPVGATQSQLAIDVNMKFGGIMGLFEPLMAGGIKKEFNAITGEIKRMVEG